LRSRRELRRVNAWMNHPRIMSGVLQKNLAQQPARRIVDLGAGDGHFLLGVAQRLPWPQAEAVLVDRLNLFAPQTAERFNRLGWRVRAELSEAAEYLRPERRPATGFDSGHTSSRSETGASAQSRTIVSNLFFHQFQTQPLAELLQLAADSALLIVALEPRRAWLARLGGRLLRFLGCGPVTRHDARVSIRAGFAGHELSALWPDKSNWDLSERRAGWCSHLFVARRRS